ncbi:hypothetical protein L2E82_05725 [Cichorium intybus]|uniref:Uncharacterized protein n=1 Tax=Cichorium intybus TaxID=13427 RepID=A0ACB9H9D4_CICIN|nr:hypothetical protein L2E82_05725 [Cichorium intybus]
MVSSSSSNSWILSLKVISAGLMPVAVTMKLVVPMMLNFAFDDLLVIWSVLVSLLKPLYLNVVINRIIITIAASTRFQHTITASRINLSSRLIHQALFRRRI